MQSLNQAGDDNSKLREIRLFNTVWKRQGGKGGGDGERDEIDNDAKLDKADYPGPLVFFETWTSSWAEAVWRAHVSQDGMIVHNQNWLNGAKFVICVQRGVQSSELRALTSERRWELGRTRELMGCFMHAFAESYFFGNDAFTSFNLNLKSHELKKMFGVHILAVNKCETNYLILT